MRVTMKGAGAIGRPAMGSAAEVLRRALPVSI